MRSLAVRVTLLGVFVAATCVSAYLFWNGESRAQVDASAARSFSEGGLSAARGVLEVRAAQQAYVASGQGDEFWIAKTASMMAALHDELTALRAKAVSPHAQSAIDNAMSSLQDFEQMDRRARELTRGGQKLAASDLIFTDGLAMTGAALASLDQARTAEFDTRNAIVVDLRQRQIFAAGAAAAAALLVIVLLLPRVTRDDDMASDLIVADTTRVTPARISVTDDGLSLKPEPEAIDIDEEWKPARVERVAPPAAAVGASVSAPAAAIDLAGVASLCTDLARVIDTRSLPAILERAARVLDAPGIVLWIADPDGRELSPIVTHGYPQAVVVRLGTILRDGQNVTAAAFRTSLLQTVDGGDDSSGAIAAPLVTPFGTVGVMAAEVRHRGERDLGKLAAAEIVAAQLATLVGPPARAHAKTEAAGA